MPVLLGMNNAKPANAERVLPPKSAFNKGVIPNSNQQPLPIYPSATPARKLTNRDPFVMPAKAERVIPKPSKYNRNAIPNSNKKPVPLYLPETQKNLFNQLDESGLPEAKTPKPEVIALLDVVISKKSGKEQEKWKKLKELAMLDPLSDIVKKAIDGLKDTTQGVELQSALLKEGTDLRKLIKAAATSMLSQNQRLAIQQQASLDSAIRDAVAAVSTRPTAPLPPGPAPARLLPADDDETDDETDDDEGFETPDDETDDEGKHDTSTIDLPQAIYQLPQADVEPKAPQIPPISMPAIVFPKLPEADVLSFGREEKEEKYPDSPPGSPPPLLKGAEPLSDEFKGFMVRTQDIRESTAPLPINTDVQQAYLGDIQIIFSKTAGAEVKMVKNELKRLLERLGITPPKKASKREMLMGLFTYAPELLPLVAKADSTTPAGRVWAEYAAQFGEGKQTKQTKQPVKQPASSYDRLMAQLRRG